MPTHRLVHLGRCWLAALAVFLLPASSAAQLRAELVAEGFTRPVAIVPDPSAPSTLFIVEQPGTIRTVVNGVVQPTPALDLTADVKFENEQGVLGLTFAPDGDRAFVYWVKRRTPDLGTGDIVISRFRRSADPLVFDAASRFDLVWPGNLPHITQPSPVHKGGQLQFGPDGYLYIGLGDGGGGGDPVVNAQNPSLLIGKMLRIDVNVPDTDARGYRVPPTNPFVDGVPVAALGEIWSFGHRNPWRWSFDDLGAGATGALIMGDVGQDSREEINYEPYARGGRNYGWYIREGTIPSPGVNPAREPAYLPLQEPMVDYPRTIGRSVTGGYVYRGTALHGIYRGRYFVADFFGGMYSLGLATDANGEARVVDVIDHTLELGAALLIGTFGRGLDGELYFSSFVGGRIFKIVSDPSAVPPPPTAFTSTVTGSTVTLGWQAASGVPVLSYVLEAGSAPGLADLLVTETPAAGLVVPGVPAGLYFVRVRATNAAGVSAPSDERAIRVGCGGPPLVPSSLTGSASGDTVSLSWLPIAEPATYLVEAGSAPGLTDLASLPVGSATNVSGPVPSGTYHVRVKAVTSCGTTPASNEIVVTVP